MKIIGLTGNKFHGKDTVGNMINMLSDNKYTFLSFAEPIKQALSIIHVIPKHYFDDPELKEKPLEEWNNKTPRNLAQWLGTDIYRNLFDNEIWLRNMKLRIVDKEYIIITDVRFDNEAKLVKELGGIIIKVDASKRKMNIDSHTSEQGINPELIDILIENNGTIEELFETVKKYKEVY